MRYALVKESNLEREREKGGRMKSSEPWSPGIADGETFTASRDRPHCSGAACRQIWLLRSTMTVEGTVTMEPEAGSRDANPRITLCG